MQCAFVDEVFERVLYILRLEMKINRCNRSKRNPFTNEEITLNDENIILLNKPSLVYFPRNIHFNLSALLATSCSGICITVRK